jgi:allophanate hydrolase
LIDDALTAFDADDPYSRAAQEGAAFARPLRLGVADPRHLNWLGDAESGALYGEALTRLAALGPDWIELDISPLLAAAQLLYGGAWIAERTAALEDLLRTNPGAIHPVVRAIAQAGQTMSAVEAFKGQYQLQAYARAAQILWSKVDALVLPTASTIYEIAAVLAEPVTLNANLGLYTNFVNLLDMSALALPAGFRRNGTGFGITLLGPAWADGQLLALAELYEAQPAPRAPALDLDRRPRAVKLAVMGAHLRGMPLHKELTSRGARLVRAARTAPLYRLYAMAGAAPPKPALIHVGPGGGAIEVEIYELALEAFGAFVNEVPPPLAIGTVTLEDDSQVKGFIAEARAIEGGRDITAFGGWRAFLAAAAPAAPDG